MDTTFWEDLPSECQECLRIHGIGPGDPIPPRKLGRLRRSQLRAEVLLALRETDGVRTKAYELLAKKWNCTSRHVMRRLKELGIKGDGSDRNVPDNNVPMSECNRPAS